MMHPQEAYAIEERYATKNQNTQGLSTRLSEIGKILEVAAAFAASPVFSRNVLKDLIPGAVEFCSSDFEKLLNRLPSRFVVVIEERDGLVVNQLFKAVNMHLGSILSLSKSAQKIKGTQREKENEMEINMDKGQELLDVFERMKLSWVLAPSRVAGSELELTFHKKYEDVALRSYLPCIVRKAKAIREEKQTVILHTIGYNDAACNYWDSIKFDSEMKKELIEYLDRDFYRSVGKAWKRGYLFSSLKHHQDLGI